MARDLNRITEDVRNAREVFVTEDGRIEGATEAEANETSESGEGRPRDPGGLGHLSSTDHRIPRPVSCPRVFRARKRLKNAIRELGIHSARGAFVDNDGDRA